MTIMFFCAWDLGPTYRVAVATVLVASLCPSNPAHAQMGVPHVTMPTTQQIQPLQPGQLFPAVAPALQVQRLPPALPGPLSTATLGPLTPAQTTTPMQVPQLPNGLQATPLGSITTPLMPIAPISPQTPATPIGNIALPAVPTQATPASVEALGIAGASTVQSTNALQSQRSTTARELLRTHAAVLEAGPNGEPIRRRELLWVSPEPAQLDAALSLGFTVLRQQSWPSLGLRQVVVRPPTAWSTAQALEKLRALGPAVVADFNHLYLPSGRTRGKSSAAPARTANESRRVGLVDGGVDAQHAALHGVDMHVWGCRGASVPSPHGTAVASLLVGRGTSVNAALPGASLYAADIYCGQAAAGAAEDVASALEWLAHERIAVINISLVGPPNRLLELVVQSMVRTGHLLVAAVGNDGPAAPALYPAAYPGVVGVTAVNSRRQVLPEAAQGPQVMFAALGADVAVAESGSGYTRVRGTSFAAPVVAGLLAQALAAPDPADARAALAKLAARAEDLGEPGRDPVFGFGVVSVDYARAAKAGLRL